MKIIPERMMKRGDSLLHNKKYHIKYIYLDKESKTTKSDTLTVYTLLDDQEKKVKLWFEESYPLYEVIKIFRINGLT